MAGETRMPAVAVNDVVKTFGGVVALGGVTFQVAEGEMVGLIGPNGSGKTTLVNVISGLLPATAGEVHLFGRRATGLPAHKIARMGLARTFQVVRPLTNMTAIENVAIGAMFGGAAKGRSAAEAFDIARETLAQVGLARKLDALADELPVLDRKRVDLARALAADPKVLLLDEVLAGLRAGELNEAIEIIRSINERGVTLIVIEHVLRVIVSLCQRVVVLDRGRKIAEGPPGAVMRDEAVIRAYLGTKANGRGAPPDA